MYNKKNLLCILLVIQSLASYLYAANPPIEKEPLNLELTLRWSGIGDVFCKYEVKAKIKGGTRNYKFNKVTTFEGENVFKELALPTVGIIEEDDGMAYYIDVGELYGRPDFKLKVEIEDAEGKVKTGEIFLDPSKAQFWVTISDLKHTKQGKCIFQAWVTGGCPEFTWEFQIDDDKENLFPASRVVFDDRVKIGLAEIIIDDLELTSRPIKIKAIAKDRHGATAHSEFKLIGIPELEVEMTGGDKVIVYEEGCEVSPLNFNFEMTGSCKTPEIIRSRLMINDNRHFIPLNLKYVKTEGGEQEIPRFLFSAEDVIVKGFMTEGLRPDEKAVIALDIKDPFTGVEKNFAFQIDLEQPANICWEDATTQVEMKVPFFTEGEKKAVITASYQLNEHAIDFDPSKFGDFIIEDGGKWEAYKEKVRGDVKKMMQEKITELATNIMSKPDIEGIVQLDGSYEYPEGLREAGCGKWTNIKNGELSDFKGALDIQGEYEGNIGKFVGVVFAGANKEAKLQLRLKFIWETEFSLPAKVGERPPRKKPSLGVFVDPTITYHRGIEAEFQLGISLAGRRLKAWNEPAPRINTTLQAGKNIKVALDGTTTVVSENPPRHNPK